MASADVSPVEAETTSRLGRKVLWGITLVVRFCTLWLGVAIGGLGLVTYMRRTARGAHRRDEGGQVPDGAPTGA